MPKPLSTSKVKALFGDFPYTDLDGAGISSELESIAENLMTVGVSKVTDTKSDHLRSTDRMRIETSTRRQSRAEHELHPVYGSDED